MRERSSRTSSKLRSSLAGVIRRGSSVAMIVKNVDVSDDLPGVVVI
jgi:hypothetical protein